MYFIPQIGKSDCGFTATKILLANLKNDKTLLFIKESEKKNSYSYFDLIELAKEYGVTLEGFEVDDKKEILKPEFMPYILTLDYGNNIKHCVFVYKISKKRIYFYDSNFGKRSLPILKFFSLWDGTGLLTKENKQIDYKVEDNENVEKKVNHFPRHLIQILSGISFILSFLFLDEKFSIFISIGLIVLGFVLDSLSRILLLNQMRKFDFENEKRLFESETNNYYDFLVREQKYKSSFFSLGNNLILNILIAFCIVFISVLNSPREIAVVFVPLILALAQAKLFDPAEKEKNECISLLELSLQNEKKPEKAIAIFKEIDKDSTGFSICVLIKKMLFYMIFALLAILILLITKSLDLANCLFLFVLQIFLFKQYSEIFSYETNKDQFLIDKMRFLNILSNKKNQL